MALAVPLLKDLTSQITYSMPKVQVVQFMLPLVAPILLHIVAIIQDSADRIELKLLQYIFCNRKSCLH